MYLVGLENGASRDETVRPKNHRRRTPAALTDPDKLPQLRAYIEQYVRENGYIVEGSTLHELTGRLYREMAEYSILTPYLGAEELEEININSWRDVALTYLDGSIVKIPEHFHSPQHAVDIVKRLLHHSGMIIDNATPMAQGHLPHNTRITVLKEPVVDPDIGIAASIRLLHPQRVNRSELLETGAATEKMLDFLSACIRYGVSLVVAGATSSGKTTLLNILYGEIHPSQGQIRYQGRELTSCQLYQAGAYILQSSHVFDDLSVEENIALGQEIDQQRMDNILQETGLLSLKGKVPSNQTLSGGEKQRLEIARALYHKRQFILADEVKANLDAKNQEKINQLLFSLPQAVVEVIHHYTKEDLKRYDKVIHLKK